MVRHGHAGMVVQIAAHAGRVELHGDAQLCEFRGWADAGTQENRGRTVRARTQENLPGTNRHMFPVKNHVD